MKKDETSAEDIATWLGRETGNLDVGYDESTKAEAETGKGFGLPQAKHEAMRKFFDGLEIEKSLSAKRREKATEAVDMADELNKSIGPVTPGKGY